MNILPKKRWHVRTKANIDRVRKDEAKAAEEEKEKQRKIQLAEQEARTRFLRDKAKSTRPQLSIQSKDVVPVAESHINLFQEVEDGQKSWGINKEHEEELKAEKEEYEKKIGLLTYLGQGSVESQIEKPWYFKAPSSSQEDKEAPEVGFKTKSFLDPLGEMKKRLGPEHFVKSSSTRKKDEEKEKEKERKKHKKHKKHKKDKNITSSGKSIDELRRERLKREMEERKRTEKILSQLRGETSKEEKFVRDGEQGYNSQFNPHLARKPRKEPKIFQLE